MKKLMNLPKYRSSIARQFFTLLLLANNIAVPAKASLFDLDINIDGLQDAVQDFANSLNLLAQGIDCGPPTHYGKVEISKVTSITMTVDGAQEVARVHGTLGKRAETQLSTPVTVQFKWNNDGCDNCTPDERKRSYQAQNCLHLAQLALATDKKLQFNELEAFGAGFTVVSTQPTSPSEGGAPQCTFIIKSPQNIGNLTTPSLGPIECQLK